MRRRSVLITGSASGIGKKIALQFAEKNYTVFINYRKSRDKAEKLAEELVKKYSVQAIPIEGDIAKEEDCHKIYEHIHHYVDGIDILIHNAGPYISQRKKLVDYDFNEWNYIVNGNLNAVFYLSKLFIPYMRKQNWGRIITFGFDRAESAPGWIYRSAFAAAKSGLVSLTKTLSLEEAKYGITVNMVSPGDIGENWKEKSITDATSFTDPNTPVNRPGTGEDIARVVAFLCDERSDFITGSVISVTGGKDVLGKIHYQLEVKDEVDV